MRAKLSSTFLAAGLLAACGDNSAPTKFTPPDHPDAEPQPDADTTEHGTATLLVRDTDGTVLAGAHVLFLAPDDSVIADTTTDGTGTASADIVPGSTVIFFQDDTLLPTAAPRNNAFMFLDVDPADHLTFGFPNGSQSTAMTVTVPTVVGATNYEVDTPCGHGSSATPIVSVDGQGCPATGDVFVRVVGVAVPLHGVDVPFEKDLIAASQTLSGAFSVTGTYNNATTTAMKVDHVPTANGSAIVFKAHLSKGSFKNITTFNEVDDAELDAGSTTVSGFQPNLSGSFVTLDADFQPDGHNSRNTILMSTSPASSITMDLTGHVLPALDDVSINLAGKKVTWSEAGGDAQADYVVAQLVGQRQNTLHGNATVFTVSVAGPHVTGQLRIPHLPAAYDAYNLIEADNPFVGGLILVQPSPDANPFETNPFDVFSDQGSNALFPSSGFVSASVFFD